MQGKHPNRGTITPAAALLVSEAQEHWAEQGPRGLVCILEPRGCILPLKAHLLLYLVSFDF